MASHFSSIGLKITEQVDYSKLIDVAYQNGDKITTELGTYIRWELGNGVELWGQIDKDNNAIGMNPHFAGSSKMKVKVVDKINRDSDTILDGALYCWADPKEDENNGVYPFVFDLPDLATYRDIRIPQVLTAQITGFAHKIAAYKDEDEFSNSQDTELKLASKSFIPAGLFSPDGTDINPPQAIAIMTGQVLETVKLRNSHADLEFLWAKINTLGGEFDIVVDPELLEGNISVGGIVSGTFWLSGRIIGEYSKADKAKGKFSLFNIFGKK